MSTELRPTDISGATELLNLAEEVQRSGVSLLLKRGEQDLAILTPVNLHRMESTRRSADKERDTLLNIIGIGESAEPTDVAHDEQEYLAEAYAHLPR